MMSLTDSVGKVQGFTRSAALVAVDPRDKVGKLEAALTMGTVC